MNENFDKPLQIQIEGEEVKLFFDINNHGEIVLSYEESAELIADLSNALKAANRCSKCGHELKLLNFSKRELFYCPRCLGMKE